MKDTIKIGDTVVRRVSDRDIWWNNSCNKHKLPADGHYVVVGFSSGGGGLRLQGFGSDFSFTKTCFDLVVVTPEQEYKEAKKLIGKTVKFSTDVRNYTVESVLLRRDDDAVGLDYSSTKHLNQHGWVVAVKISNHLASINVPVGMVKEVPSETEVVLNSSHTAVVTKDTITVGCQTFPVDILKKLQTAVDNLAQ